MSQQDFTIVKSPSAIASRVMSKIFVSEVMFALTIYMLIITRQELGVDYTFAGLFWLIFILKAVFVIAAISRDVFKWSGEQYYTNNGSIVAITKGKKTKSEVQQIDNLQKISVSQTRLQKFLNYGTIKLSLSGSGFKDGLKIYDVENPHDIAHRLEALRRTS